MTVGHREAGYDLLRGRCGPRARDASTRADDLVAAAVTANSERDRRVEDTKAAHLDALEPRPGGRGGRLRRAPRAGGRQERGWPGGREEWRGPGKTPKKTGGRRASGTPRPASNSPLTTSLASSRKPSRAMPCAAIAESCGQTEP